MAERLAQRELRNDNARVIDRVVAGATFIVTRHGKPVAELRPIPQQRRTFVPRHEVVALANDGHIDGRRFREDLDAVIDQGL